LALTLPIPAGSNFGISNLRKGNVWTVRLALVGPAGIGKVWVRTWLPPLSEYSGTPVVSFLKYACRQESGGGGGQVKSLDADFGAHEQTGMGVQTGQSVVSVIREDRAREAQRFEPAKINGSNPRLWRQRTGGLPKLDHAGCENE
jgi:hypothetical protein